MKNKRGITLIALIITIIVLLILAGVSINAVIGDNGIITNAQNAKILQSCATLEEFLNDEYMEIISNDIANSNNYKGFEPIEILEKDNKTSGYFYIPKYEHIGNSMYILDAEGRAIYLIKKSGLPNDIQANLVGGNANNGGYNEYFGMNDVYGVTSDLKVYYCSSGVESIKGIDLANLDKANPNAVVINNNNSIYKLLSSRDSNNDGKISVKEIKSIDELTIDSTCGEIDLNDLIYLSNLKRLNLKDVSYNNLDALQYVPYLELLSIDNATVEDCKAIKYLTNLRELFLQNSNQIIFDKIMLAMSQSNYSKLETIKINNNDITDISNFSNQQSGTKTAVKYLYLNSNDISCNSLLVCPGLKSLLNYKNVEKLYVNSNSDLITLSGIDNMTKLNCLDAKNCNLGLNEIYENEDKTSGKNKAIDALACLEKLKSLDTLDLRNNINLKWIEYITVNNSYSSLHLEGCTSFDISSVTAIADTYNLSNNKDIESKYKKYLSSSEFILYGNLSLTDNSDEIKSLEKMTSVNKQKVKVIDLSNNNELTDDKLTTLLSSGFSNLFSLRLTGCTNLRTLSFLEYLPNLYELKIKDTSIGVDVSGNGTGIESAILNANTELKKIDLYCKSLKSIEYNGTYGEADSIKDAIVRGTHGLHNSQYYEAKYNRITLPLCIQAGMSNLNYHKDGFRMLGMQFTYNNGKFDLTSSNIETFQAIDMYYILPSTTTSIGDIQYSNFDISRCVNLTTLSFNPNIDPYSVTRNILKQVEDNSLNQITSVTANYYKDSVANTDYENNFNYLKKTNLTTLNIVNYDTLGEERDYGKGCRANLNFNDDEETDYVEFASLKNLTIYSMKNFSSTCLNNCQSLENIKLRDCGVDSLDDFSNLENLVSLDLKYNSVCNLGTLEEGNKLKNKLVTLDLRNNNIDDSDIQFLKELNQNGKLKKLYLSGNNGITASGYALLKTGTNWEDIDF